MKKVTLLFSSILSLSTLLFAQSNGDYVSIKNGNWADGSTWSIHPASTPANSSPSKGNSVYVKHKVVLTGSAQCANLTIDKAGNLVSDGPIRQLVLGIGMVNGESKVENNGTLGSLNSLEESNIVLYPANTVSNSTFTLSGTGKTYISGLRTYPNRGKITINIKQDCEFNELFTLLSLNKVATTNEDYTVNIYSKVLAPKFHREGYDFPAEETGGNYTYNVYGTLEVVKHNGIVPTANNDKAVTSVIVKKGGTYNMNGNCVTQSTSAPATQGTVKLVVEDGGVVDATKSRDKRYFVTRFTTEGSGVFKIK